MFFMNNNIDTDTRYDTIKFINFNKDNIDPLNCFMLLNVSRLPEHGTYIVKNEQSRPDLLSYSIYNDTQYWWLLMLYNDITDIKNLKTGMTIRYFDLSQLEELYMKASLRQKAV